MFQRCTYLNGEEQPSPDSPPLEELSRPSSAPPENIQVTPCTPAKHRKTNKSSSDSKLEGVLSLVKDRLESPRHDDQFDAIGRNVAAKLRNLPKRTRIIAEKLVGEVLFQAEMDILTVDSKVTSEIALFNMPLQSDYNINSVGSVNSVQQPSFTVIQPTNLNI